MAKKTTINIHRDILAEVAKMSEIRGESRTSVIIMLLKMLMDTDEFEDRFYDSVSYQESDSKDAWHKFHITFRDDDYNFFINMRCFFKMSVSKLLAYAVKKFLSGESNNRQGDNYPIKNYFLIKNSIDDVIYWQIFWGYTPKMGKYILLE